MTLCLVTGASGYVGSRLVAALADAGREVVATARDARKLAGFDWPAGVRRVALDVSDPNSIRQGFQEAGSVEVAYFLVHSIGDGDFAQADLTSARQFAAAASAAGIARVVYLGGFVPEGEHLSAHLKSRADVGDALSEGAGVELVWLRAAIILGAGSTSFELIRHIADRFPVIALPTWMNHPVAPIAVDDVLYYLNAAADPTLLPAGAYDISNGEQPSYAELLKSYALARGLHRIWVPFPPVSPRLVALIVSRLTPLPRGLVADLIMSLPNRMGSTDHRIRGLVPDPPGGLTSIADALRRTQARAGEPGGVAHAPDALALTDTDPTWAGSPITKGRAVPNESDRRTH